MKILSAHQPQFIPWLGFFSKIYTSNDYIILDDLKYSKSSFQTRNQIRVNSEKKIDWLKIPVIKETTKKEFNLVEMDMKKNWKAKHLKSLSYAYSRSDYFDEIFKDIESIYNEHHSSNLLSFNLKFIFYAIKIFNIRTNILLSSEIKGHGFVSKNKKAKLLCDFSKYLNCDHFLFGSNGKKYFDEDASSYFKKKNILPIYQIYSHPKYIQKSGEFYSNCSFLDLLFNYGKKKCLDYFNKSQFKILDIN